VCERFPQIRDRRQTPRRSRHCGEWSQCPATKDFCTLLLRHSEKHVRSVRTTGLNVTLLHEQSCAIQVDHGNVADHSRRVEHQGLVLTPPSRRQLSYGEQDSAFIEGEAATMWGSLEPKI